MQLVTTTTQEMTSLAAMPLHVMCRSCSIFRLRNVEQPLQYRSVFQSR